MNRVSSDGVRSRGPWADGVRARGPGAAALIALAALAVGCEQAPPTPGIPAEEPAPGAAPVQVAPAEISEIIWPPVERVDRKALEALPDEAQAAVRASHVPVLVPPRPALLAAPTIVAREHWTSFSARTPEITVFVMATRIARRYAHIPPTRGPRSVRGLPAFVTQNEGIWSATWMENGVSYTLDLECASPEDAACATDALLLEIAGELAYVGGAGAGGGR
jgi:hypothetical protein